MSACKRVVTALSALLLLSSAWLVSTGSSPRVQASTGITRSVALARADVLKLPGVYVHAVAIRGDSIAWVTYHPVKYSGVERLYVDTIGNARPTQIKTNQKWTVVEIALSNTWIVWEAQPPGCYVKCHYPAARRALIKRALARHHCGGAIPYQPWYLYAQNLQTHQRVLLDSSVKEEPGSQAPENLGGLWIHGATVGWAAIRTRHCTTKSGCYFQTRLRTASLPSPRPTTVAASNLWNYGSNHPCLVAWVSGQVSFEAWERDEGLGCRSKPSISGADAPSLSGFSRGKQTLLGSAGHYVLANIESNVAENGSKLVVRNVATGHTELLAAGSDAAMSCDASIDDFGCGKSATISNGLVLWMGGYSRNLASALYVHDLSNGYTTVVDRVANGMLEPYMYAAWNHTFVYPISMGSWNHPVSYLRVVTLPSA